jgi:hypothetical protein
MGLSKTTAHRILKTYAVPAAAAVMLAGQDSLLG